VHNIQTKKVRKEIKEISPEVDLLPLSLPIRFENLEREIEELGLDITTVVEKVDEANEEIETLLKQINHGKNGKFKLFYGDSGKGKTTFLKTLEHFFQKIEIISIERNVRLHEIPKYIITEKPNTGQTIVIIEDRDNPNESSEDLRDFFEELRFQFRKELFEVLIIWPITDKKSAEFISNIAWDVGRDSITSANGCIFEFNGIPKTKFHKIADITSKNLNEGRNLESYGISKKDTDIILKKSDTIGQFYTHITDISLSKIDKTEEFLKDKIVPKIWILLPGDEATEIDRTVRTLTRGVKYKIDVERILSELDNPNNKNLYLADWRKRRGNASHLLHLIDVRLFPIPPSLSLAAIRAFGEDEIKKDLKNKKESQNKAIEEIKKSPLYKLLLSDSITAEISPRKTTLKTSAEYMRVQKNANKIDKKLNQALGKLIVKALESDNINAKIEVEKQNIIGSNMQPDIQIKIDNKKVICLEPTWRTTGKAIESENISEKTNSLTTGHLQQYVLNKAMDYLKSIEM
jgi:hypothetical protein